MLYIPFGTYRPDVSDFKGEHSPILNNVLPRADGYGPLKSFSALSGAMAAACRGAFRARKSDGSVMLFAGTSTKLYLLDNTDYAWDDVSKAAGSYTALPATDQWQFEQFGNYVVAMNVNVSPQYFLIGTSTAFDDLAGSPPQARYCRVVGKFLVLSGLASNPFRIHWSGLNAITTWTSGTNSSDYQDFADGGVVRTLGGGQAGTIFQDGKIRRMTYAPGSPIIFQIDDVTSDMGIADPLSVITANDKVYFRATQGFHEISPGGYPKPLGREYFDATFAAEYDSGNSQLMIGAADPRAGRVFWAYKTTGGTSGLFNKILCYDTVLKRATTSDITGEYLVSVAQPGVTLESLDSISGSIDALTQSLDSFASASAPEIGVFNSSHVLGTLRGANLEATLETPEKGEEGDARIFVRGVRPITDAPTVYASLSARETQQATSTTTSESLVNAIGECPVRVSTRNASVKLRIPASTTWTYAAGVDVNYDKDGAR
jgi:hypothetical protein